MLIAFLFCSLLSVPCLQLAAQDTQDELLEKFEKATDKKEIIEIANRLSGLSVPSEKAQKLLLERLKSEDGDIRGACVDAIFFVGKPTPEVVNGILDSMSFRGSVVAVGRKYVEVAGEALANAGPEAIPIVAKRLSTDDKYSYFGAMDFLHRMGSHAKDLVPTLVERLEPGELLWATIYALEGIGKDAKAATDRLIEFLDDEDFNIVCITCRAIGAIGPDAAKAKNALLKVLKEGNVSERGRALEALGKIGVAADEDVKPLVLENLKAFHQSICDRTMTGIGALGKEKGNVFIKAVEEALAGKKFKNKPRGAITLYQIGGSRELVLETLDKWLANPTYEVNVLDFYGEMGPDAKPSLPMLLPYLEHEDDYLKAMVLEVISKIEMNDEVWKKVEKISQTGDFLSMRTARQLLKKRK